MGRALLSRQMLWSSLGIVLAGGATVAVGLALLQVHLILAIAGGAAAYLVVAVGLRVLTRADVTLVLSMVRRKPAE